MNLLELKRQAEQIKDIEAEVDLIDSNLKRAEQLLFKFTRRMVRLNMCDSLYTHTKLLNLNSVSYLIFFMHHFILVWIEEFTFNLSFVLA